MTKVYFASNNSSKHIQSEERKKFLDTSRAKLEDCLQLLQSLKFKSSSEKWSKEGFGEDTLNYSVSKVLTLRKTNTLREKEVLSIIKLLQGLLNNNEDIYITGDVLVDYMYRLSNEFYDNYYEALLEYIRFLNNNQNEDASNLNRKDLTEYNKISYPRNPLLPNKVIKMANYVCDVDSKHSFFISAKTMRNYVEAHHLIPLAYYEEFSENLDVEGNMVSLCIICHEKLHHGQFVDKSDLLINLYNRKKEELTKCGLNISLEDLKKYYQTDLNGEV